MQKIKVLESQNELKTLQVHNRALTLMTDFNMTPDMIKDPVKIINPNFNQKAMTNNPSRKNTGNNYNIIDGWCAEPDTDFNFTLELYSYEETEAILTDILTQVSGSNHLLEFLSGSEEFRQLIESILDK